MVSKQNRPLIGSFYIVLSSFFFGSYGIWARLIGNSLANFYQIWTRCIVMLLILIPIGILTKQFKAVKRGHFKWIALYAGADIFTFAPMFYAFNIIGIGPTTLLFYSALTVATFLAGVFSFGEKMTRVKIAALFLSMVGLCFVFSFSLSNHSIVAAFAAIVSGIAGGINQTYIKKVSGKYSPLELSVFGWSVVLVSHIMISKFIGETWAPITITTPWFAVFGNAFATLSGFFLVILGYKYSDASVGAIVGLFEVLFGIAFGLIIFHESLTISIAIGACFIILAALLPNVQNLLRRRRITSSAVKD